MKDQITYSDFSKLDIRAGKIVEASLPEWSDKLIRYVVDLGDEVGMRVLFSCIRKWYNPEDMINKTIPVVINLAPKKMGSEESQGMAIMVDGENSATLIFLPDTVIPGSVIR